MKYFAHNLFQIGDKLLLLGVIIMIFNSCSKDDNNDQPDLENTAPQAAFTVSPSSGTTQTQFAFDATGCSDEEDNSSSLQVRWDWENDGNYDTDWSSNKTVSHKYSSAGNFTVTMEVKDSGGLTDAATRNVTVEEEAGNTPPTASFTVNPEEGTTETEFYFDASGCSDNEDSTDDLEVRWDWENDGNWDTGWSTDKTETRQYNTEGNYTIKLEVRDDDGATDYTTQNITVDNNGGSGNGEPCPGLETITYGGQVYNTVLIGNQCWLAVNLNYEAGNSWCYDNDPSNCDTYGRLYDWETALTVCPSGWKLPSDDEWKILEGTVDSQYPVGDPEWDDTGYRGLDAGKNLKSTSGWNSNRNGTDLYGFGALPGGRRYSGGSFNSLGNYGYWWSSSEYSGSYAWSRTLSYDSDGSHRYDGTKTYGRSVRCLKD
jgi:uncharacterized protein (TIGR02145 family)